jgi:hypothetical protein
MLVRLRRSYGHWLASGGYLLLLFIGAELDSAEGWRVIAALISALALVAWVFALRYARAIADTPTSNIASAAQGYVELLGRGLPAGAPLAAPLKGLPCLWYRYRVERKQGDKWVTEESGESTASFQLDDGSGRCLVDPEGAEVLPRSQETWHAGERRYMQALLIEGEPVYVIGNFRTLGGDSLDLSVAEDVKHLLAEWKRDMPTLMERFDRNGDGMLDMEEWERARAEARREVERNHRALRAAPDTHLVGLPSDDRLYLISSLPPEKLRRRYLLWTFAHLAIFFAALAGAARNWTA